MRTEIDRLNGRIDRNYMFNDHFIRGQEKMELMLKVCEKWKYKGAKFLKQAQTKKYLQN